MIQVGEDNSYDHPTPQTLRRLQTVGAKVFRSDEHGDVIVTIKDNKASVTDRSGLSFTAHLSTDGEAKVVVGHLGLGLLTRS